MCSRTSSLVAIPRMSSTNAIAGTGFMKCMPTCTQGCPPLPHDVNAAAATVFKAVKRLLNVTVLDSRTNHVHCRGCVCQGQMASMAQHEERAAQVYATDFMRHRKLPVRALTTAWGRRVAAAMRVMLMELVLLARMASGCTVCAARSQG